MNDEDKTPSQLIAEFRTLREAHACEIAERDERFEFFVRDAAFGYGEADLQGSVTLANPALGSLTGYTQQEMLGRPFLDFIDERDRERAVQDLMMVLTEPNDGPREYCLRRKDGTTRHVDVNTIPVLRDGAVVGFRSTMVDITARKLNEEALRDAKRALEVRVEARTAELAEANRRLEQELVERRRAEQAMRWSEEQYRSMIEAMGDGIHVVDRELRIQVMNPALVDLGETLGLPMDFRGKTVFELFPFLGKGVRAEYAQVFDTGQTLVTEEQNELGGRTVATETRKIPILDRGEVARVITVLRDVTEQRRAREDIERQNQELTRANEQLERLHRTKDEFIATVSHELRTPLVTGLGYLELFLAGKLGPTSDAAESALTVAQRNLQRLSGLIDDLLSYHTLVRGEREGRPVAAAFDGAALLAECRADFLVRASRRVEQVVLDVPEDLPPLHGDEEMIRRAMSNLLNNADQHAGDAAQITLAARPAGDAAVTLSVSDDGAGIAAGDQAKVFDPFFKASGGRGGAGLGLAIVRSIVEAHGQSIALQSAEGRGTRIAFELPVAKTRRVKRRSRPSINIADLRAARSASILVVDDDEDALEFFELLLRNRGYQVKIALTAESAMRLLEAQRFDLLVLDMSLPGMDGDEICEWVRGNPDTAELPVIFLSARAEDAARERAAAAGCSAYLVKPVEVAELAAAIRDALEDPTP